MSADLEHDIGPPGSEREVKESPLAAGLIVGKESQMKPIAKVLELQGAEPVEPVTEEADDAWLSSIRLRQDYAETAGVEKVLLTVPFRKPNRDEFFRVHPSAQHRLDVTLVEFKTERELFVVLEAVEAALLDLASPARLFQCINRQGTTFVWPAKLPIVDRRNDAWRSSALEAATLAEKDWMRISADMNLGAY